MAAGGGLFLFSAKTTVMSKTHSHVKDALSCRFIKRTCRDVNDATTLKTLYCSLVRPRVEYDSQVWNPFTKSNISRIESIQRI